MIVKTVHYRDGKWYPVGRGRYVRHYPNHREEVRQKWKNKGEKITSESGRIYEYHERSKSNLKIPRRTNVPVVARQFYILLPRVLLTLVIILTSLSFQTFQNNVVIKIREMCFFLFYFNVKIKIGMVIIK